MTAREILHKDYKVKTEGVLQIGKKEKKLDNWTGDPGEVEEQVQSRWEAEQKNIKSEY